MKVNENEDLHDHSSIQIKFVIATNPYMVCIHSSIKIKFVIPANPYMVCIHDSWGKSRSLFQRGILAEKNRERCLSYVQETQACVKNRDKNVD